MRRIPNQCKVRVGVKPKYSSPTRSRGTETRARLGRSFLPFSLLIENLCLRPFEHFSFCALKVSLLFLLTFGIDEQGESPKIPLKST